jgi:hypothetical protein
VRVSFKKRQESMALEKKNEQHKCGYCSKAAYGLCGAGFPIGCTPMHAICRPSASCNGMQQLTNDVAPRFSMHKRAAMEVSPLAAK